MILGQIYKGLASAKLALALLVVILVCCVVGVTIVRGQRAWELIFSSLWFNSLLVLLVTNITFCFFPRMWGRKLTLISIGMILFHLSFVAMLGGIVYNSLFYFKGLLRLTEGETLSNGELRSYDSIEHGRFFSYSKLKGDTTLIKLHRGYNVDGEDKQVAYEVSVGEGDAKRGIIYVTHNLDYNGFKYLPEKEGYSPLIVLSDMAGRDIYAACVSLQSLRQKDGSYLYITGTKAAPGSFFFPQNPVRPLFHMQMAYTPSKFKDRGGDAYFLIWPIEEAEKGRREKPIAEGKAAIGEKFAVGDYYLSVREVRYWVGMTIRHDPGKPIVLTSLWVGFGGLVLTFIGRMRKGRK